MGLERKSGDTHREGMVMYAMLVHLWVDWSFQDYTRFSLKSSRLCLWGAGGESSHVFEGALK